MNILLLEDDDHWADEIKRQLEKRFAACRITRVATEWAFRKLLSFRPLPSYDVAIFDIMVRWANYAEIMEQDAMSDVPSEVEAEFDGKQRWRAGVRCKRLYLDLLATFFSVSGGAGGFQPSISLIC